MNWQQDGREEKEGEQSENIKKLKGGSYGSIKGGIDRGRGKHGMNVGMAGLEMK